MITPRLEYRNLEFYEVHKVSVLIIIISKSLQLALITDLFDSFPPFVKSIMALSKKREKTVAILNYTPKVRQEKSNFWGVFIMKLTFEDKIQICKLLKQGCTFVWNKNRFVDHNDK